ncbi:hypothetical protein MKD38_00030 [Cupriavidus sp. WGlv3]|nr:hypothetical protein [Cupriavidus sp. WGlv3]MCO4860039.1 hypothetical protein [Cupriavidus sp. WGlv3]
MKLGLLDRSAGRFVGSAAAGPIRRNSLLRAGPVLVAVLIALHKRAQF